MDWSDPEARLRLLERVGPQEYNRQMEGHIKASTVDVVAGHKIRAVASGRFGRLFQVGKTGYAFQTLKEARDYADKNPAKEDLG